MMDTSRLKNVKTVGGMLGGAVEALALQPLDTIKTRLQLSNGNVHAFTIGKRTFQQEGFLALYKGLTPFGMNLISKYALRFYSVETYRYVFASVIQQLFVTMLILQENPKGSHISQRETAGLCGRTCNRNH